MENRFEDYLKSVESDGFEIKYKSINIDKYHNYDIILYNDIQESSIKFKMLKERLIQYGGIKKFNDIIQAYTFKGSNGQYKKLYSDYQCSCSKKHLHNLYFIANEEYSVIFQIGSKCIGKFKKENPKLVELCQNINRRINKKDKSVACKICNKFFKKNSREKHYHKECLIIRHNNKVNECKRKISDFIENNIKNKHISNFLLNNINNIKNNDTNIENIFKDVEYYFNNMYNIQHDFQFQSMEFQNIYKRINCFYILRKLKNYSLSYNYLDNKSDYYINDYNLEDSYLDVLDVKNNNNPSRYKPFIYYFKKVKK